MSNQQETLTFYFDPLCPWAWMTSLWAREVAQQLPLSIEWKFFALAGVNSREDQWLNPLRICAQARREGGNEAVNKAYLALGRLLHGQKEHFDDMENLASAVAPYLQAEGLDPLIAQRALQDPSTAEEVMSEHQHAVDTYSAFGVPWLLTAGDDKGFFGPVIGTLPQGQDAMQLWEHFRFMAQQPALYELKRGGRKSIENLPEISKSFGKTPAGSR